METMTPKFTRLIAEIRTRACINGVNAAAIEELLKDALHECYNAGYDAGYDAGFNPGYDAGYYVGHSESHSAVQCSESVYYETVLNNSVKANQTIRMPRYT